MRIIPEYKKHGLEIIYSHLDNGWIVNGNNRIDALHYDVKSPLHFIYKTKMQCVVALNAWIKDNLS